MKVTVIATLVLAAGLLAGCSEEAMMVPGVMYEPAVIYADTRISSGDGFTLKSPQWAYEGEPVTLDFGPDLSVTDYVVFSWPDGKVDVLTRADVQKNFFRGVGTFKAAAEPRKCTVRATAFMRRTQADWYFDQDKKVWVQHISATDTPDLAVGSAEMEIVCYRRTVDIEFNAGGRVLADAVLHVIKGDGTRVSRRTKGAAGEPALEVLGPDAKGVYRVRYTPTFKEVSRTGQTDVELVLSFKDGTQDTVSRKIDTP
jgi:hypothetical protein